MYDVIYTFHEKDITMNVCIQIRAVINVIMDKNNIPFEDAMIQFYYSDTYKTLQNTENGLWAESPEYIADQFFEEKHHT